VQAIAEVVSATVTDLVAQSLSSTQGGAPDKPRFGSFLAVGPSEKKARIIAVVNNVLTGPVDGVHRASAFGLSREELRNQQPQIFALLRTDVHASIIGFIEDGRAFQHLPPHPPEVHDFVYHATTSDIESVTSDFDFLRQLSYAADGPIDELLAATIREAYMARGNNEAFLHRAGQAFSQLFRSDYERLVSILKKIKPHNRQI
jgi:hypothetical protein